jgi:hypothetical protein
MIDEQTIASTVHALVREGFQTVGDLFPPWSAEDRCVVADDGKIPTYMPWQDRLAAGEVGLDALMNVSAYYSLVADQAALDAEIAANIAPPC